MKIIKDIIRKTLWTVHKRTPLPAPIFRYILSFVHDKNRFKLKQSKDVFSEIYNNNFWYSEESKSGSGSTLIATQAIREQLPMIFEKFFISSMLDVPCGDYHWMKEVDMSKLSKYLGGDIVAEAIKRNKELYSSAKVDFLHIDITESVLPTVDLIFCRDCLQHLSDEKVIKALNNFKKSNSKYLLVTSYPKTYRNFDILDGDYRALNLNRTPINYPKPLFTIVETKNTANEVDKIMALYCLKNIPFI